MNILLVTADFPPFISGVGDYTDALALHLRNAGADVSVLTTGNGEAAEGDDERPFTVLRKVDRWNRAAVRELAALAESFDAVHVQYPGVRWGRSPWVNLMPLLLRRYFNKIDGDVRPGLIVTYHEFRSMRSRWRLRAAGLMVGADAVVTVDDEDLPHARKWASYVSPVTTVFGSPVYRGIAIAPNAEPVATSPAKRQQWREQLGLAEDELAAVFFGILYPHKGVEEMLDAIDVLRDAGRKIRPVVVGDFDRSDDWTRKIEQRLEADHIVWQRGVSLQGVSEVLHACDVGVLPFHTGCGPNRSSLLACVAHGLPTITTDGPCTPESFRDESPLVYVPVQNAGAIGGALRRLMDDKARRDELREASLDMASKRTWPEIARQHLDLYSSLGQEESVEVEASV